MRSPAERTSRTPAAQALLTQRGPAGRAAAHEEGVHATGAEISLDGVLLRDVSPSAGDDLYGRGVNAFVLDGVIPRVTVRRSVIERTFEAGINVAGGHLILEHSVIRDTRAEQANGFTGYGVAAHPDADSARPSGLVELRWSLIEDTEGVGVLVSAPAAALEGLVVRRGKPGPGGDFGRGINVQRDAGEVDSAATVVLADRRWRQPCGCDGVERPVQDPVVQPRAARAAAERPGVMLGSASSGSARSSRIRMAPWTSCSAATPSKSDRGFDYAALMTAWRIERMQPDQWQRVRAVRLRSLEDAPDAFGTTLAEDEARPAPEWIQRLERSDAATFVAVAGGQDVGLVTGRTLEGPGADAGLYGLWLDTAHRGQGVAGGLIDAVVDWARTSGCARLLLEVGDYNTAAIRLYESKGFVRTGKTGSLPPPRQHVLEHERALVLRY